MYCIRKVNDDYTWVGADCRRLALFEGVFGVPDGVSFNSYLLMDDKTVLFDTVDSAVRTTFRENVAHVLNGRAPDYLVVHHMEPDHAAEMADLARQYPDMAILCSAAAKNMIAQFFDAELAGRITVVKEGDTLCTGRHTLRFIAAPMVHWPEVLMTYDETDKLLLSADAFGRALYVHKIYAFLAISHRAANATGSLMAISDSILRLIWMPATFRPCMKVE